MTTLLEHLLLGDTHASFRPIGEFTLDQAVAIIDDAIAYCRDNELPRLIVDIRGLTGFPPPTTFERFSFATKWTDTARGNVILAMIAPQEMIDPDKIGITVARNRGMRTQVFTDEAEGIAWLLRTSKMSESA